MNQETWTAVDAYISGHLLPEDDALSAALATSVAAGLPPIQVTPSNGKLLNLLARLMNARRILEIGTLGGYSTIWLGRAVAATGGRVISLEADPRHAGIARGNIARAGLDATVEIRLGKALDTLPLLQAEMKFQGPFDMFFIDADKANNAAYFAWALQLSRVGSLIIVDNVVRKGAITNPASPDADVQGTQRFYEALAAESRVDATAIQMVGSKGYDGIAVALVVSV